MLWLLELADSAKVSFDGHSLRIVIAKGVVRSNGRVWLDTKADIYQAWKRWVLEGNMGLPQALEPVGGHADGPESYFVLKNGWRLQPPNNCDHVELSHLLITDGNGSVLAKRPDETEIPPPVYTNAPRGKERAARLFQLLSGIVISGLCLGWWRSADPSPEPVIAGVAAIVGTLVAMVESWDLLFNRWPIKTKTAVWICGTTALVVAITALCTF